MSLAFVRWTKGSIRFVNLLSLIKDAVGEACGTVLSIQLYCPTSYHCCDTALSTCCATGYFCAGTVCISVAWVVVFLQILDILSMLDWQTAKVNFLYMFDIWYIYCCFMSKLIYRIFVTTQEKKIFAFKPYVTHWRYFFLPFCVAPFYK